MRQILLRRLMAMQRFPGRDRLVGRLSESFARPPVTLADGLVMELDPHEWIQLEILAHGGTEPLTSALMQRLLGPGDVFVDVGAHVGYHALIAARAVGPGGRVYAFDPQPYNCDRIARNAHANGLAQLLTVCAAVGDRDGTIRLPLQSRRDRARLSLASAGPNDLEVGFETAIRRLDSFFRDHRLDGARLVKIDVEGYELAVLEGLAERLTDCDNVVLELLPATDRQQRRAIVDVLIGAGFVLKDVTGRAWREGSALPEHNLWAARERQA